MQKYKSIWISDLHLGTKDCQAEILNSFLTKTDADVWYLVGDIVDMWKLKTSFYWDDTQTDVFRNILQKTQNSKVIYIAGNHDEFIRDYLDYNISFGAIELHNEYIHHSVNREKFLVIHGDKFDQITKHYKWLAYTGDVAYSFLLWTNRIFNKIRKKCGCSYWSLSAYLKRKTKEFLDFVFAYEDSVAKYASKKGCSGVICGHIHTPVIKKIQNTIYMNDGDFVESCSVLVETLSGDFFVLIYEDGKFKPTHALSAQDGKILEGTACRILYKSNANK